ncbi:MULTISPECIES: serine protease [Bradyrhizobium]|uniref:Peptidoglycan-binding protein n=1 Tax=Bradyrhizobium diversitatis TaxID=2755406 RepID=A0ABS0NXR8_9BRAD|nr:MULTISPECIES: serine protease [Bradyrhizobium]KYK47056.1 peptidoglycan-binding protein [Bradyrhizobium liaoningense]MBH5385799.1 peptidoglycan-binding protein [Bradyrhizobium diversitatis]UPJ62605.1 peptidoglycan-binding protein [Bradyrhizobium sp. 191]
MRSMLAATLMFAAATGANAQMTAPQVPGTKPKTVQTVPIQPPAMQTPSATADAMAKAERLSLQSDLAWVGQYNGAITGDVSERMVNAIKEYQKAKGGKPTGVLNPQERATLAEAARKKQESVGWKIVTEPTSGARLGIPGKLVPQQTSDANGSKWTSPTGTVQVVLSRRKEANPTSAKLADLEKEPSGRKVDYTVVKPDFFVLSGLQGLKKFYVRGTFKGDEVRTMTILYDQATENTVEPVVIAMSSAFNAFPSGPLAGPPPRKTVEYGTGIVVSQDGAIVTDRLVTDGCLTVTIAGHGNADRLAEDKEHDLALLHIYGARGLQPLSLAGGATKTNVDIVGIADPQSQGGAAGVSSVKAALAPVTSSNSALSPPPAVGFSGSPAVDADGKFAGIALLKPALVAGPATSVPASQALMVSAEAVRGFLKGSGITANGTSTDAKAAIVRVICVRK